MNSRELLNLKNILLALFGLVIIGFFIQNSFFLSFDYLYFRSVDDYAFHQVLRSIHISILNFDFFKLFQQNQYGYGWLFWITYGLITFPFFLMTKFGVDWPLIWVARNLSVLFILGSSIIIYKLYRYYDFNYIICCIIILFFITFPITIYISTDFKSIAFSVFLTNLSLYLLIVGKNIRYGLIAFAAAGGVKLNCLIVAPLVFYYILENYSFKLFGNFSKFIYFLFGFVFFLIVFTNPALFLSPFKNNLLTNYMDLMNFYINNVSANYSKSRDYSSVLLHVISSFTNFYLYIVIFIFSPFILFLKTGIKTFLPFFLFHTLSLLFLIFSITMGELYIALYFLPFAALWFFPFYLTNSQNYQIIAIAVFALHVIFNFQIISNNFFKSSSQYFSNSFNSMTTKIESIREIIKKPDSITNYLIDYNFHPIYPDLKFPKANNYFFYDNLYSFLKTDLIFDHIVISKKSNEFKECSAQLFNENSHKCYLMSQLFYENKFNKKFYDISYSDDDVTIFTMKNNGMNY